MSNLPPGCTNKDIEDSCANCSEDGHNLKRNKYGQYICRNCGEEFSE